MSPTFALDTAPWTLVEAARLHELLRAGGWRVAAGESLTCGRVQTALGAVSGASAYLAGGITAYTIEAKARLLGVSRAEAEVCEAVSESVARAMAVGVTELFDATAGVATTGYAEPAGQGRERPFAWVAVALRGEVRSARVELPEGDRASAQAGAAAAALRLLSLALG